jgi:hypothetical protein
MLNVTGAGKPDMPGKEETTNMTRNILTVATLGLALVGGSFAAQTPSKTPNQANQTQTVKVKKHRKVKKTKKSMKPSTTQFKSTK